MIFADDMRQRAVVDADGLVIGDVESIFIDVNTWRVGALRIRLRRDMTEEVGATKSLFGRATIDIPTSAIQSVGDAVLLRVRAHELRAEA